MSEIIRTYRFRIKDGSVGRLNAQARAVNLVWNYCNEVQKKAALAHRPWLTGNQLGRLCSGATKEGLDLHANSVERVCRRYAQSRSQHRKPWLRWRGERSLGWIPFRADDLRFSNDGFRFKGAVHRIWRSREIPAGAKIGDGCFSQDARGRWYINVPVKIESVASPPARAVGIDLGLKSLATLSDGGIIAIPQPYRRFEQRLGMAQRASKKRLATAIHAKIANCRRDYLHKASATLANEYGLIVVGDVSPSKLARTKMAKSVLDAGWSDFRRMVEYKAIAHGSTYLEINEAYTTRACAECGSIAGPEGQAGLRIREWTCGDCGSVHDRDVNAARNILRLGHQALAGGAVS